jgi:xanthine dehydrogenase YagT iron-sulfur-binding subunit
MSKLSRRKFLETTGAGVVASAALPALEPIVHQPGPQDGVPRTAIRVTVNGREHSLDAEDRWTLAEVLRDHLQMTGTKIGCDRGECGACTVLLDGKPVYSCLVLAADATGKKVTTVEGLGTPESPNAVQAAFVEQDALMCGFCTPGFVTTLSAYLKRNPNPTPAEVREACKGNFCRCGTYPRVFEAALAAAKEVNGKS